MKICPSCRQTYADDDLNFCLTDGSFLTTSDSEPKTTYMNPSRVTNQTNWQQQPGYQPPAVWQNQQSIQNQPINYPMRVNSQDQTLPTISLILGILAAVTCCLGGIPLGAGAIITGVIALNNEKSEPTKYGGRGLAIGGIVTGAAGFAISIIYIILAIVK
ncbi:MAG: DUF4190 domain-containing protein [Actinomycetota bacterium]